MNLGHRQLPPFPRISSSKLSAGCRALGPTTCSAAATLCSVTYQILNQYGGLMSGGQLSGTEITESISNETGNAGITAGPPGSTAHRPGSKAPASSPTYFSSGSFGVFQRGGSFFQAFTASGLIGGVPYSPAASGDRFWFQHACAGGCSSPTNVTINGLGLGTSPSTKCQ